MIMLQKKIISSIILVLCITVSGLKAQSIIVKEKNGSITTLNLKDIHKLSFAAGNMEIYTAAGDTKIYDLNIVKSLSFTNAISTVSLQVPIAGSDLNLFPNPADEELNLSFESLVSGKLGIIIFDSKGRKMKQELVYSKEGKNQLIIDVSELPQGLYICRIQSDNNIEAVKFLKK